MDGQDGMKPLQTALHDRHLADTARMIDFSGWHMPIQYRSIIAEHQAVRSSVGVFDLSHMGRLYFQGADAHRLVQWLATNDVSKLRPGRAQYSLFCAADGRILDDIVVYNQGERLLVVVNASNREKIVRWIADEQDGLGAKYEAEIHDATFETAMIGFQGPDSEASLQPLVDGPLAELRYYSGSAMRVVGVPAFVARTGYTGEDGFEVIVSAEDGPRVWDRLLEDRGGVVPTACGLGCRDTLRLEAGMALYGHEIDESTNPYEAGLGRVAKLDKGDFVSREALGPLADRDPSRRLIAFELDGGVPRQGYSIIEHGQSVGRVTSGTVSPTLGKAIGMGYVPPSLSEPGCPLAVEVRGRAIEGRVVALPFYQHRTKRQATVRRGSA